jgi:hypothetical protein
MPGQGVSLLRREKLGATLREFPQSSMKFFEEEAESWYYSAEIPAE